jgi:hypothetical protein
MAIEKKWESIPPVTFVVDGSVDGVATIPSTSGFKVKQEVYAKSNTVSAVLLQIKRVLSATQLVLGPKGTNLETVSDLTAFTVADGAVIYAEEQARPSIPLQEHERAVYEEEPTVAKRVFIVDELGNPVDAENPLPVLATVSDNAPQSRFAFRVVCPAADTEMAQIIPNNTKKLYVGIQDLSAKLRVSFTLNGTIEAGVNNFTTIQMGNSYFREGLKLVGKTLYFQSNKAGVTVEIEAWV